MTHKKQKTNWFYLCLVVFLAVLSGGLIWQSWGQLHFPPIVFFQQNRETEPGKTKEEIKAELDKAALKCFCREAQDFHLEEWGELKEVKYTPEEVDLDQDGIKEIIAAGWECLFENYSFFTGGVTGNQLFCIFQKKDNQWQEIGQMGGEGYGVQETQTNGYFDLISNADAGWAGCLRAITDYQWDGAYYQLVAEKEENVCPEE